jgi:ferritin
MLGEKMLDAINEQIKNELYSSYLYLSMAAYFSARNLNGFANWMQVQAKEEDVHAMMMYRHVIERQGRVELRAIPKPPSDFASATAVFEHTLEHERGVTRMIDNIVELAREEKDHATEIFYQWFVTEQVEEEANADEVLRQLKLIKESGSGMIMLDRQMAARIFVLPAAAAAAGAA